MDPAEINRYYLQVLKGESPKWPRPEDQLTIGSQDLGEGYTQYWAYHQDSPKTAEDLPPAEIVASENPTPKPAILVDQPRPSLKEDEEDVLDLILVRDGHAYFYTPSSISSLKDNIEIILDEAVNKFDMEVEHFMTTGRVSEDVEKALDDLEDTEMEGNKEEEESVEEEAPSEEVKSEDLSAETEVNEPEAAGAMSPEDMQTVEPKEPAFEGPRPVMNQRPQVEESLDDLNKTIPHVNTQVPSSGIYLNHSKRVENTSSGNGSSKLWLLIPVILLVLAFGSVFMFRDRLFSAVTTTTTEATPTPTQAPSPTPTPAPAVERKNFKVRVLNGTTKTGAAGTLASTLKDLGWDVTKTGNNDDQKVEAGFIRFKEGKEDAVATMIADLGTNYTASSSGTLKSSDTVDLEVVIGSK